MQGLRFSGVKEGGGGVLRALRRDASLAVVARASPSLQPFKES